MTDLRLPRAERAPRVRRASVFFTWGAAVCLGVVTGLMLRVRTRPDVDLWLHVRIGDLLRSGERFRDASDPLAALADRPYVPTQWLAQVGMSAVYEGTGMTGLQVVRLVLVIALAGAVLVSCRVTTAPAPALFATAITMFGTGAAWGERPQLVGLVLLAVTVGLWWRASDRRRAPWVVVPLAWIWTMLHGSWLLGAAVGIVVLVGAALDQRWRGRTLAQCVAVVAASLAASLATPLGWDAVIEPFRVSSLARLSVHEWQRPAPDNPLLLVVLASAVIALLGLLRSSWRRWTRALTVVFAVALTVWMVRTIAVGAIVLAPALAHGLSSIRRHTGRESPDEPIISGSGEDGPEPSRERLALVLAAVLALGLGGAHIITNPFRAPVSEAVSSSLAALPPGTVLAVDGRAVGWVQWAHPNRRPLRDLRAEVYSPDVAHAYKQFQEARPGWQDYAESHGVTAVLADRSEELDPALAGAPDWTAQAEDARFRLWVHQ